MLETPLNGSETALLINRLADSWCRRHRPESMSTDWGQSLLAYGLQEAVKATGSQSAREYLRRWLGYHSAAGIPVTYFVGSWSPGLLFPDCLDLFPELALPLRAAGERIYSVILNKAIRNGRGVLLHNVDLPHIYVDTVYFAAPILARIGTALGRNDWPGAAMFQLREHLAVLRDRASNFWIHCEENLSGNRSQGAWARGNGWVAMTCAELMTFLPADSPEWKECAGILDEFFLRLIPLQTDGGLWGTILDNPRAYEETSASAMFLFAMLRGRELGALSPDVEESARRCLHGLAAYVDPEGRLLGCSEGTWPGTVDYYLGLERGEWWWGTGAALLALAEALRYPV